MISIILISPTKKRDGDLKFYFCSNPSAVKSNILAGGRGYLGTEEPHLLSQTGGSGIENITIRRR